jgi:hypothetical protein
MEIGNTLGVIGTSKARWRCSAGYLCGQRVKSHSPILASLIMCAMRRVLDHHAYEYTALVRVSPSPLPR